MTSERIATHPPRLAAWLVETVAGREESDAILGDLYEEFIQIVRAAGPRSACRWYWRQSWRTVWQLAASPLWTRPAAALMIALLGITLTRAFGPLTSAAASATVTRYPIYWYVPAPLFWGITSASASFLAGFVLAFVAPEFRLRAVSAAVAVIVVLAVWLALDRPIFMVLFGRPLAVRITFASSVARWASGVLSFGGATLAGAILSRTIPLHGQSPRSDSQGDIAKPMLWMAALSGAMIGAILMLRYEVDVIAPIHYTVGVVTLRSRITTWTVVAAIALPSAYAAWRYGRAMTGFVVGLAGGCIGGIVSSIGVMALLLSHDPTHIRWADGRALGPFGDAVLPIWTQTAIAAAIAGLSGRLVLRPLSRRA